MKRITGEKQEINNKKTKTETEKPKSKDAKEFRNKIKKTNEETESDTMKFLTDHILNSEIVLNEGHATITISRAKPKIEGICSDCSDLLNHQSKIQAKQGTL